MERVWALSRMPAESAVSKSVAVLFVHVDTSKNPHIPAGIQLMTYVRDELRMYCPILAEGCVQFRRSVPGAVVLIQVIRNGADVLFEKHMLLEGRRSMLTIKIQ